MQNLMRQPTNDIRIRAVQFGPTFLKHHHPNLLLGRQLRKTNLAVPHRKVVVNHHLLQHSVVQDTSHVNSIGIHRYLRKDVFDTVLLLSEGRQRTQQIAISQLSLQNVSRLDLIVAEDGIGGNIANASPSERAQQVLVKAAEGVLIGWKIRISILILRPSVLRHQLFVVGFLDLARV